MYHSTLGLTVIKKKQKDIYFFSRIKSALRGLEFREFEGVGFVELFRLVFAALEFNGDRLRVGTSLRGVLRGQKMLKGHLPRVIYR